MELIQETMEPNSYQKYDRARKRVKEIKGFYNHIWIFVLINIAINVVRFFVFPRIGFVHDDPGFNDWLNWNTILMPLLWGIGLAIHGIWAYRHKFKFLKNWEERKIKEYIEEEEEETQNWK
ncbi:MAG: 2TM domain-containing protein [Aureisphaera sp.]